MSVFNVENQRTELTYRSCSKLGMRYIDTLAPQYILQIEEMVTDKSGWSYPTFYEYVRVIFRPSNGYKAEMRYTTDHHSLSDRNWIEVEDPSEEDLIMIVGTIRKMFDK